MNPIFICYERCSTCKKAEKWLTANGIDFEKRSIVDQNPSSSELSSWITLSSLPVRKFFNTSGMRYRELNIKNRVATDSVEDLVQLLSSDGMLVKRPLLITDSTVLVGFREEEYAKTFL